MEPDNLKKMAAEAAQAAAPVRMSANIEGAVDDNTVRGAAAVMGNMDRNGGVIVPGFFQPKLKEFLHNGFVAFGHDYNDMPIAMPTVAEERDNILYTEAVFHQTPEAQSARAVCQERMDRGLAVGLSVGFYPDYSLDDEGNYNGIAWFESGPEMIKWLKKSDYDLSLFDLKSIRARTTWCRLFLACRELIEYSIVPYPANPRATATEINSVGTIRNATENVRTEREFEDFLRDAGFSRKRAAAITLHGWKTVEEPPRDAGADQQAADQPAIDSPQPAHVAPDISALLARERELREFMLAH